MYMYKIQSVKLLTVVVDENQLHKIVQSQKINGGICAFVYIFFFFAEFPSQQLQQQQQQKKNLTANYVQSRITKIIDPNACTSSCI